MGDRKIMEFGWINLFGACIVVLRSAEELLIYVIGNGVLLLSYYFFWAIYSRKKSLVKAMALAVIPTVIFFLSGILLRHWLLVYTAVLFGFSHCRITYITHKGYKMI